MRSWRSFTRRSSRLALALAGLLLSAGICAAQPIGGGGGVAPFGPPFSAGGVVTGPIKFPDGTAPLPAVTFAADVDTGLYRIGANNVGAASNGVIAWDWNTTRLNLSAGYALSFNGGALLFDESANTVGLRNGANPQTVHLYGAYTDAANNEFLELIFNSGSWSVRSNKAGSGTVRPLVVGAFGSIDTWIEAQGSSSTGWKVEGTTGYWKPGADNTLDIGATATLRPRTGYFGTSVVAPFHNSSASSILTVSVNVIAPTGSVHHVGAGLLKTITVPAGCTPTCSIAIIPDAAYTYDATGNIVLPAGGGTAVINKAMTFVWDGAKWTPSY